MPDIANLNGTILPAAEARVPVLDRSFLYGDGVYETLRTYGGRPFLLDRHLDRLQHSASRLEIPLWHGRGAVAAEVERTLAAADAPESALRIVLTRGSGLADPDPRRCSGPPMLVILQRALVPPAAEAYRDGIAAVVVEVRRNPSVSLDPLIKSNNLLNNLLAAMEARSRGAGEAILLNPAGEVAEASNANVFLVLDGTLRTPALDTGILAGITREVVLDLAREIGVTVTEERIPARRLADAAEIFLTSTTREILPVSVLDGLPVGDGRPGPVTRRLHRAFRDLAAASVSPGTARSVRPPAG